MAGGQLVIQKQVRNHKYNPKGMVSLDNTIYNIKLDDEYKNRCKLPEDMDEAIDYNFYGNSILNDLSLMDIEEYKRRLKQFKNKGEYFEWLV